MCRACIPHNPSSSANLRLVFMHPWLMSSTTKRKPSTNERWRRMSRPWSSSRVIRAKAAPFTALLLKLAFCAARIARRAATAGVQRCAFFSPGFTADAAAAVAADAVAFTRTVGRDCLWTNFFALGGFFTPAPGFLCFCAVASPFFAVLPPTLLRATVLVLVIARR